MSHVKVENWLTFGKHFKKLTIAQNAVVGAQGMDGTNKLIAPHGTQGMLDGFTQHQYSKITAINDGEVDGFPITDRIFRPNLPGVRNVVTKNIIDKRHEERGLSCHCGVDERFQFPNFFSLFR